MNDTLKTVKLKNGTEEVAPLVSVTMLTLRTLFDEGMGLVVYELAELCKKPDHKPFGNMGDDLKRLSLASESDGKWHVHDSIRNIVLSAIEGEGLDMRLGSPVAENA